jgi:hypothetical protein
MGPKIKLFFLRKGAQFADYNRWKRKLLLGLLAITIFPCLVYENEVVKYVPDGKQLYHSMLEDPGDINLYII